MSLSLLVCADGSYCKKHGIILQAYASLGGQDAGKQKLEQLGGPLLEHEAVLTAATHHSVSAAQVLLRWALQKVRLASCSKRELLHAAYMVGQLFATPELTFSGAACWLIRASQSFQKRLPKNAWRSTLNCMDSISPTQRWQHSTRSSAQQQSRGFAGGRTQCGCSILSSCGTYRDSASARLATALSNC